MGRVWLAIQARGPRRLFALKRLHAHLEDDPALVRMFLDEALVASRLDHPGLCRIVDFGRDARGYFAAMAWEPGAPLAQVLAAARADPTLGARLRWCFVRWIRQGAQAVHAAHELHDSGGAPLGLVHRDLTPKNLLVGEDGDLRVLDFGVARAEHRLQQSRTGEVKGTLGYIAPEALRGEPVDRRADVWTLGVVLWEAIAGRPLFAAEDWASQVAAIASGPLPGLREVCPDVPLSLDEVVARALARDPGLRHPTAEAFARDLALAEAEEGVQLTSAESARLLVAALPDLPALLERLRRLGERAFLGRSARRVAPFAALGLLAALGAAGATARTPVSPPASGAVALGPLEGVESLGPAAASLSYLAERALRDEGVEVLAGPGERAATCEEAARRGARYCFRVQARAGSPLEVRLALEPLHPGVGTLETTRSGVPEDLPLLVQEGARRLGAALVRVGPEGLGTELDQVVSRADRALAQEDGELALLLLEQGLRLAPTAPLRGRLALAAWWSGRPAPEVVAHLDAAEQEPAWRAFAAGMRLLRAHRYAEAESHFEDALAASPSHPWLEYGRFEALFHRGLAPRACELYRATSEREGGLPPGAGHFAAFVLSHDDERGVRWLEARSAAARPSALLPERLLLHRADPAAAAALLHRRLEVGTREVRRAALPLLLRAEILAGNAERVPPLAEGLDLQRRRVLRWGLALLRGDRDQAALQREAARRTVDIGALRFSDALEVLTLALAERDRAVLEPFVPMFLKQRIDDPRADVIDALLARQEEDRAGLQRWAASATPEAASVARASLASLRGQPREAAQEWAAAAAQSADGRFLLQERFHEAEAWLAAREPGRALAACAAVTSPRSFSDSWFALVTPCLELERAIHAAAGDAAAAAGAAARLDRLRSSGTQGAKQAPPPLER